MKLTTIAVISKPTRNNQRSNEHVQIIQDVKVGRHISPWFSPPYLGALQSPFGDGMETIHAYTSTKPNIATIDFQLKIEVSNPLQHRKPSPPKRHVIKDLICGKAIGCQYVI
jgi:hypothetical protein